ncbi:MAG: 3-hydroxyacyl-CoA dehydrogenase family protein [Lachnospiraceae bacterium]|nr:3-hydroxyacyl-CoA dehydrogenase family protein [Lachnospiraceae bacterium]
MSKKNIAVLGAGKMGLGIAQLFATKGHNVKVIYVYDDKTRYDSAQVIRDNLSVLVKNDVLTQKEADEASARIGFVDTIEEVADFADIVFEGIIENLEIKQDYFKKMDEIFPVSTVLATNTSAISVTEIAEKSVHKERIIGTHYWNPAYLIPLVEVIKTKYVSDETVKKTYDLLEEAGKKPVIVKKDVPGFLANRMQHALFREALSIIENDIADPKDVDDAIKYGFGMRLGICAPVEVMDMGGLDLTYSIHNYLFPHIESSTKPSRLLTENIEKGNLGFKTGKGLMEWSPEDVKKANVELTEGLIKVAKALDRL